MDDRTASIVVQGILQRVLENYNWSTSSVDRDEITRRVNVGINVYLAGVRALTQPKEKVDGQDNH